MTRSILTGLGVAALVASASAQQVTPLWYQHINGSGGIADENKLPILINRGSDAERADGDSGIDAYTGLFKYDDNRLILGVRENGIIEASASAEEQELAAKYPDRSLIWLDAKTGKPLGIAWKGDLFPADAIGYDITDPEHGKQGSKGTFFWRFGIQDGPEGQRALYVAYHHLILRYAPKPEGGWETIPTIAYEEQLKGITTLANGQPGDQLSGTTSDGGEAGSWRSWRARNFGVYGAGNDTTLLVGGGTWRIGMHPQMLVTTDGGLTFKPKGRVNDRDGAQRNSFSLGGLSSPVVKYGKDAAHPNLLTVYHGHFPATGYGARPDRYIADPDSPIPSPAYNQQPDVFLFQGDNSPHGSLPAFSWEAAGKDGLPVDNAVDGVEHYDGNWNGTLAAHKDLDYIVSYAIPSWDHQFGAILKPAWLGIHTLNGEISTGPSSAFKLEFTENDEIQTSSWQYDPWIQLIPDTTAPKNLGKATAYVSFGNAGFGVFNIQNVAPSLATDVADTEVEAGKLGTLVTHFDGGPNRYRWFKDGVPLSDSKYISGSDRSRLTMREIVGADAGQYRVEVTNPLGQASSRSAKVKVRGAYLRQAPSLTALAGTTATSSTTAFGGSAPRVIDQNTDGNWGAGSVFHSDKELNPWVEVDLGQSRTVGRIVYWGRTDCCAVRSTDVIISVKDEAGNEVFRQQADGLPSNPYSVLIHPTVIGKVVRVERQFDSLTDNSYLNIAEIQVYGDEPPRLVVGTADSDAVIVWDADSGAVLESSSKIEGPYTPVVDATSPYSVPTSGAPMFFRAHRE